MWHVVTVVQLSFFRDMFMHRAMVCEKRAAPSLSALHLNRYEEALMKSFVLSGDSLSLYSETAQVRPAVSVLTLASDAHSLARTHTHVHVHTHTHTHTHVQTRTHTHTDTQTRSNDKVNLG